MTDAITQPAWRVLADGLAFPEGPAFDADGALWVVELQGGALVRIDDDGPVRIKVGGAPNGLAFSRDRAWFCDADAGAIRCLDRSGATETIVASSPSRVIDRPNDLAFDAAGNLLFTCPGSSRQAPTGAVWCLHPDGDLSLVADELYFPNGLAFAPNDGALIVAETYRQRLWRGPWDAHARRWLSEEWAATPGPIGPDGMAFATDGDLFVAVYGQQAVIRYGHDGTERERLATPGANPTNVAFDPAEKLGMIVTEAARGEVLAAPDLRSASTLFQRSAR